MYGRYRLKTHAWYINTMGNQDNFMTISNEDIAIAREYILPNLERAIDVIAGRNDKYTQYVDEFRRWFETTGIVKLIEYAKKCHGKVKWYQWLKGQLKNAGVRMIINIFATWLVKYKHVTIYEVVYKNRLISGVAPIYRWLKVI